MNSQNKNLNPFAFPPDTNALFTLLVVSAVLWTIDLVQVLRIVIGSSLGQSQRAPNQDFLYTIINFIAPILLMIFVFLLAFLIYLTHPGRIRLSKSSQPITRDDDPKFWDAVSEISTLSNISPLPKIEISSRTHSTNAQVFGFRNSYTLRLDRGLRLLLRQDGERFRAIILHELAHIANGDIARTYLTQAIWAAIIALGVIPVLLLIIRFFLITITDYSAHQADIGFISVLLLKMGCMLLIIASIRRNILRSRELFADQRAGIWGARQGLIKILQGNAIVENQVKRSIFWRFHPSSKERLETLQNSSRLFHIRPTLPILVGMLIGLAIGGIFSSPDLFIGIIGVIGDVIQNTVGINLPEWSAYLMFLVLVSPPILIMSLLVSTSLGIAVQRETIAHIANGKFGLANYISLGNKAILLAMGFEVGSLLTISSMLDSLPELLKIPGKLLTFSAITSLTVFLLVLTSWLVLIYLRFFSRRVTGNHTSQSLPKAKIHILSLTSSLILMGFYTPIFFLQGTTEGIVTETGFLSVFVFLSVLFISVFILYGGLFIATSLSLWAYNSFHQTHCPTCGYISKKECSVGQTCNNCGNELAPWLYTTQPSET